MTHHKINKKVLCIISGTIIFQYQQSYLQLFISAKMKSVLHDLRTHKYNE